MKKTASILLMFVLLFSLAACSAQNETISDPVNFYYRRTEMEYGSSSGVIGKEVRDAQGLKNNYEALLSKYLQGPESYDFYHPYPRGTSLISLELQENTALVQLSAPFADLTGLNLSIACACLTLTVCGITGADQVRISAMDAMLDGQTYITMSPDSILLLDNSNIEIDPN